MAAIAPRVHDFKKNVDKALSSQIRPNHRIRALKIKTLVSCSENGRGFGSLLPTNTKNQPFIRLVFLCLLSRVCAGLCGILRTSRFQETP